ncbi:MAG: MupG family TIM beta-alpha barrel fold protein [Tissierellaceae bacterium]
MKKLGISIYPDRSDFQEDKDYLSLAAKYGFKRVFLNLLSVKSDRLKKFKDIVNIARGLDMEVIADVSPAVFEELNIDYKDLKVFNDMGLAGIRLDMGFSGIEESIMSFNNYNLKIELNISSGTKYLDNIISYLPNKENIIGCHNFYPHRYSGISRRHFIETTKEFKKHGIRTAAFVSSQVATFGPWDVREGLPTLEEHRDLPIDVQAKDLFNTDLIDDVIVSNCYASEEELKVLGTMDKEILTLNVKLYKDIPKIQQDILFNELHFNRGDVSEYMIRSTQSRLKYKGHDFELINPRDMEKGDVIIESSLYAHYAGEMQIALKEMKNSNRSSVVGKVVDEEIYLLDSIKPWQKFRLKESK